MSYPSAQSASSATPRRIGVFSATLLVVASMIGVGVFTTTGFLLRDLESPVVVLLAWFIGALAALCGALAYAELCAALPANGGEYQLLSRIYHPAVGFLAGWISLIVGFSAPLAAASLAFGRYFAALVPRANPMLAGVLSLVFFSVLHAARVSLGSRLQNGVALIQALLVLAMIITGAVIAEGLPAWSTEGSVIGSSLLSPAFAVGLIYVSFAYSGWNAAAYIAGEVVEPQKGVPRALILGTALVALLYLGLNWFFLSAPVADLVGVVEVAHVAAQSILGSTGALVVSAIVALGVLASQSALILSGSRIYEAIGRDYPRLRFLGVRGEASGPARAIALQSGLALLMMLTASFDALLTYIGFCLSLSAALTIIGVEVLRRREPTLLRPYRAAGHPWTTAFAALLFLWMSLYSIVERPWAALAGLFTLGLGGVVYRFVAAGNAWKAQTVAATSHAAPPSRTG